MRNNSIDVTPSAQRFDVVSAIMDYESGNMTEEDAIEFFQHLLDTGTIYSLQGSYQRTAQSLLDAGLIVRRTQSNQARQNARERAKRITSARVKVSPIPACVNGGPLACATEEVK